MTQQLFIHVGMPKTGTTGLQFYMYRNRKRLREQGVYYPVTMREPAPTATQHRFIDEYLRRRMRLGVEGVKDYPNPIRRVMFEIRQQDERKNVISEEQFSFDPAVTAKFLAGFREQAECKIVVFLRRQDTWAESMYAQAIRGGYREPFERFLASRYTRERLDYAGFLGVWAEHFGPENIIAVPYVDRKTRTTDEMVRILGIDGSLLVAAEHRNQSLSGEAIAFIHAMRVIGEPGYPMFNRIFGEHFPAVTQRGSAVLFTPEERADFLAGYAASNDEVVRSYLGRDPAMTPLFDADPASFPPAGRKMRPVAPERQLEILVALLAASGTPPETADLPGRPVEDRIEALVQKVEEMCRTSTLPV